MSAQTDELKNIIASLTNIVAALEAAEAGTNIAPDVPSEDDGDATVPAPDTDPETPDAPAAAAEIPEATTELVNTPVDQPAAPVVTPEQAVPAETPAAPTVTQVPVTDGTVADNTPSATPQE